LELFWFALDIPRYESKTSHLTMLQDGAYNRLMRHYYKTCAPIPANEQQIVIIAKAFSREEIEAVSFILKSFFTLESDGWHHATCDEEIAKARAINKKRVEVGRLGGLAKARVLAQQTPSKTLDSNNNSNKELKPKAKALCAFELPTWVPQEAWDHYTEMRNRIRKPMTDQAKHWAVKLLARLRSEGHDPAAVLEQSVFNSWQGLFEVKGDGTNRQSGKQSRAREVASNNLAAAAAVGWSAPHAGAVTQQGTDFGGNSSLASEVKRLQSGNR